MHWALNPLFFLAVTQRAPVKSTEGLVQISKTTLVTKGSGGSWDRVTAFLWVGAGRWRACRHRGGRPCAHSFNTNICLRKLTLNLLPNWCWVLDVTQRKAALNYPKINVQAHLHSQTDCAPRGNDFWCCGMFAGPDHTNQGEQPQHLLPSAKHLPLTWAFLPSMLI